MRHVVIFDVKGDWMQMLQAPEVPDSQEDQQKFQEDQQKFHERCHVRLMTFGTDHGWPATLDPFPLDLNDISTGRDGKSERNGKVRLAAG
jgi:hypothetical protein